MLELNKKTLRNVFLVAAACIFLYWLLHETERVDAVYSTIYKVVFPFFLGASIAFIINVPMRAIEGLLKGIKNDRLRRVVAVLLTFVAVLIVLAMVFWMLIPQLIATIQLLVPQLYSFVLDSKDYVEEFLNKNPELMKWVVENTDFESFDWASLVQRLVTMIGNSVSAILSSALTAIGSVTTALMNFVIAFVFALYCLFQKETLARQGRKLLYAFVPERISDHTIRVLRLTNSTFSNFLSGQCVEVCILGALFAVTMAIFKMPYIPLVSVLVAVTAFIPVVGAWAGCVLGAFFILVANPIQAVWFVIMFVILQQIENNMIYPRVVGTSIGLSGMWVLVAVAVGGELMGVAGMFLMIPVASVLHTLLRESTNRRLQKCGVDAKKLEAQPPELRSKLKERRDTKKEKRAKKQAKQQTNQ